MADRKISGGEVENRVPLLSDISFKNALARHVRTRSEETIRLCVHLAYLRMRGVIPDGSTVSVTGAAYQDARGTRAFPRAHVLPGNVCVNGSNIPDLIASQPRLAMEFTGPLKRTDMLPLLFNYADRLFEDTGGIDALADVARWVIGEQDADEPIAPDLIDDAYYHHIVPGYHAAYLDAARRAGTMTEEEWRSLVRQGQSTITAGPDAGNSFVMVDANPTKYLTKRDDAGDILRYAAHVNDSLHPSAVLPAKVQEQIALLDSLGGNAL